MFSDKVNLVLSESFLTFNICRVVFENFDFEKLITETVRRQIQYKYNKIYGEKNVGL